MSSLRPVTHPWLLMAELQLAPGEEKSANYGNKNGNLLDILAYWDTHDHSAAFTQLQSKAGLPGTKERLNAGSTVTDGSMSDVITAANTSAIDWFFASAGTTINNGKHGTDCLNNGLY
jgi:hypothetical protein